MRRRRRRRRRWTSRLSFFSSVSSVSYSLMRQWFHFPWHRTTTTTTTTTTTMAWREAAPTNQRTNLVGGGGPPHHRRRRVITTVCRPPTNQLDACWLLRRGSRPSAFSVKNGNRNCAPGKAGRTRRRRSPDHTRYFRGHYRPCIIAVQVVLESVPRLNHSQMPHATQLLYTNTAAHRCLLLRRTNKSQCRNAWPWLALHVCMLLFMTS